MGRSPPHAPPPPRLTPSGQWKEDERRRKPALPAVSRRRRRDPCAATGAATRTQLPRCQSQKEKKKGRKKRRDKSAAETRVHSHLCSRRHLPAWPTIYPSLPSSLLFVLPFSPGSPPRPLPTSDAARQRLGVPPAPYLRPSRVTPDREVGGAEKGEGMGTRLYCILGGTSSVSRVVSWEL